MYIPREHYTPRPSKEQGKLPLLVDIHASGHSMLPIYNEDDLPAFADDTPCAVLAPLFPAGLEGPNDVDSYKVLRTESLRADLVLLGILDEVAHRWPGIDTERIYLSGYSGGGQFVHRFLYLYPHRLRAVSIGAPGSVTYLDNEASWPDGIADIDALFDTRADEARIRKIPIQLLIGEGDTEIPGDAVFWDWVRDNLGGFLPPAASETRMESIIKLRDSWERHGIRASLDVVEGVDHDSQHPLIRKATKDYMRPLIQARK